MTKRDTDEPDPRPPRVELPLPPVPPPPWVPATERMKDHEAAPPPDLSPQTLAALREAISTYRPTEGIAVTGVRGREVDLQFPDGSHHTAILKRPPKGPRPGTFAPPVVNVLSDPHTQAGIRGMWAPHEWERPDGGPPFYRDKNGVMVYARDASDLVLNLDDAKANTLVICLGKWFAETNGNLALPEATRVYVEDILAFRGIKKHVHGGYEAKQKEATKADVLALRDLWVRSHQTVWETAPSGKRKRVAVDVDDPLVIVSLESTVDLWGERTPYAFRFRPGPWAQHYLGGPQHWTTPVLKTIMGYHPERDRLKMRLGIYLAFQWRVRSNKGNWDQPWKLRTLLEGAKLAVPARNPQRFFPRVLRALDELRADGVLALCEALDFPTWTPPAEAPPKRWVPQLLDGRWRLEPAEALRDRLPSPPAS